MRILIIGQLPKEIGGNYTTGAANVVYELSKQREDGVLYYTYGTNITDSAAIKASSFLYQYIGYKFRPFSMLLTALCHPLDIFRHMMHYHTVDHQSILRFAFYEANIREAIKRVQPDLIHVNSIANVSPVRFAIGKSKIPMLLTCHGIFYRGDEKDVVNRDRNLGNIKLADAYSGLTLESLNEYESILGIPKNRVAVIPNGVDCKKFYYSPEARAKIRKEFDVKDGCKVFITVASVQERKGQLVFLKMLSMLDIDFRYWIVGKGPDEEVILQYVEENGLQGKVRMLGYKAANELYKYYSAADELQWIVTLSADFTFNGTTSSCTYVREPKVEVYAGKWSAVSKSASKVGNVATGKVEMKKGGLFISKSIPVTVTLSCDKNGNLT